MSDIRSDWNVAHGYADWCLCSGALASGDDLATAVLISVFSERQANASDLLPDAGTHRRGWWGDQDKPIGSRLWLLERSKLNSAVAITAKGYITEALQWLIEDKVASAVQVDTSIIHPATLAVTVSIHKSSGQQHALNFNWAWPAH